MKVTCIIIASLNGKVEPRCLKALQSQDYEDFDILIHYEKPVKYNTYLENLYKNCSRNRNIARKMALSNDSDYFLFLDSDIVLPRGALKSFMLQTGKRVTTIPALDPMRHQIIPVGTAVPEIHIQGGWYPIYYRDSGKLAHFVSGKWVADNTFAQFKYPEASLISCDALGLGCCFMSRAAVEDIEFEDGMNIELMNDRGQKLVAGECTAFGNKAFDKDYSMYMNGDVICEHIKPWRKLCYLKFQMTRLLQSLMTMGMRLVTLPKFQTT